MFLFCILVNYKWSVVEYDCYNFSGSGCRSGETGKNITPTPHPSTTGKKPTDS